MIRVVGAVVLGSLLTCGAAPDAIGSCNGDAFVLLVQRKIQSHGTTHLEAQ